jgi:hypothetical protein
MLIESFGKGSVAELRADEVAAAEKNLKLWEDGIFNYAEFEKMVGRASSLIHSIHPRDAAQARQNYLKNLEELIAGTARILESDGVKFPNHWDLEGTYAWVLSRAPFLVGRSGAELASRLPVLFFSVAYAANLDLSNYGIELKYPDGWTGARNGVRDCVNAWAVQAM